MSLTQNTTIPAEARPQEPPCPQHPVLLWGQQQPWNFSQPRVGVEMEGGRYVNKSLDKQATRPASVGNGPPSRSRKGDDPGLGVINQTRPSTSHGGPATELFHKPQRGNGEPGPRGENGHILLHSLKAKVLQLRRPSKKSTGPEVQRAGHICGGNRHLNYHV